MATELGSAFISVGLGTNTLAGDIKKAFGSAESSGGDAGKSAGRGFGAAFGVAAAALAGLGIGSFFKSAVSGAAELQQSVGAIDSVFKGSAGQMHEWAKSAATDVGLSANEFNELGTLIGSQLKNGGTAMDELAPKTQSLISTGADLASMFGGTTAEAVGALSSALKGERDPIERYGVSLNQAKIDAEAAALGFQKVGGSLSAEASQAATLSLIMKQTADAHGNFASEADTLAHKQQVLNAQWANGKARIGDALLPAVSGLTGALSSALGPAIDGAVAGIKTITGGAQGLYDLIVKGDFSSAFATAFNVQEDSGAVAALFTIRETVISVFGGIKDFISGFALGPAINSVFVPGQMSSLAAIGASVREVFDGIWAAISPLIPDMIALWQATSPLQVVFAAIQPLLPQLMEMFGQLASIVGGTLMSVFTTLVPILVELSGVISQSLGSVLAAVLPVAVQMITMLGTTIGELLPIIMPIIATVIQLATTLISQLAPIVTELISSILPPLVDIFGNILSAIGPVITMVAGLLIPIIQALMPVVVTVFGVIADVIKAAMQIVQGVIQVVTGIITGNWSQVWEGIQNIFGGIWNAIVAIVSGAIKIVWSVISAGIGLVMGFISGALNNISRFFADTWNNVVNGVSGMIGNVVGFFSGLIGKITGAIGNAGNALFNTGRDIIQGLINGISGMMGAIGRAVLSIVPEAIRGPFEDLLGIHSPSRVFMGYGVNIGQGLINGLDGMHGKIASAVTGMVSVPAVPSFGAGSYTPSAAHGANLGNTYNTTINQVDDPIGTSHAVQRRLVALTV